jgi:hypothetical protein
MLVVTLGSRLHHHTMGKAFKVVAISDSDEEANEYMERNPGVGVIDCHGSLVIMCQNSDEGKVIAR